MLTYIGRKSVSTQSTWN